MLQPINKFAQCLMLTIGSIVNGPISVLLFTLLQNYYFLLLVTIWPPIKAKNVSTNMNFSHN